MNSFEKDEQHVKKQAIQIRDKLVLKREKKQQEYQKQIKQELIKQYQQKFDIFKNQIEDYTSSQLSSLDLIKEFRMGEISEFENKIAETIKTLEMQEKTLMAKQEQVQDSLSQALEFLNMKREKQCQQKRQEMELELQQLVKEYQERIQIE